jgi:hypothetical protein
MIGKRDFNEQNGEKNSNPNPKKVKTKPLVSEDSEESEDEINFKNKMTEGETEDITFEFFPANKYFSEGVNYMLKKNLSFLKSDFGSVVWKICDQTEMGIFVGTSDDSKNESEEQSKSGKWFYLLKNNNC